MFITSTIKPLYKRQSWLLTVLLSLSWIIFMNQYQYVNAKPAFRQECLFHLDTTQEDATTIAMSIMNWYLQQGIANPMSQSRMITIGKVNILSMPYVRQVHDILGSISQQVPQVSHAVCNPFNANQPDDLGLKPIYNKDNTDGNGVDLFILDNGIDENHTELIGRAIMHHLEGDTPRGSQKKDHGTNMAVVAASSSKGIAKKVTVFGYNVIPRFGFESDILHILLSLQSILETVQHRKRPAVISISHGVGHIPGNPGNLHSKVWSLVINELEKQGIIVVASAGSSGMNACKIYPAALPNVIAVGGSEGKAVYHRSNYGKCVNIYSPIAPIIKGHDESVVKQKGLSMATVQVAAALAVQLGKGEQDVKKAFRSIAIKSNEKPSTWFLSLPAVVPHPNTSPFHPHPNTTPLHPHPNRSPSHPQSDINVTKPKKPILKRITKLFIN